MIGKDRNTHMHTKGGSDRSTNRRQVSVETVHHKKKENLNTGRVRSHSSPTVNVLLLWMHKVILWATTTLFLACVRSQSGKVTPMS